MKKSTLAVIFTILLTFSCIFASCNSDRYLPSGDTAEGGDTENNETTLIRLEEQLLALKQNQYITDSKRAEEIARLEALIAELKQSTPDSTDESNTTGNGADTEADTGTTQSPSKFIYTVNGEEAILTGYTGTDSVLTLPSYIDGYKITSIADDAFTSDTLRSVVIPNTITKIGWFAFKECKALKTVTVPESVQSIGYSAFPQDTDSFTVICTSGSFAAKYAESYGIDTTLI